MPEGEDQGNNQIGVIAVKLAPIWDTEVDLWFANAESQFALSRITEDSTKFHHVCAALSPKLAKQAAEVIRNPPAAGKYEALKAALCASLELTKDQRVKKILHVAELGTMDPMELWSSLQSWSQGLTVNDILLQVFLEKLPPDVQQILQADPREAMEVVKRARSLVQNNACISALSRAPKGGLCFYHKKFGVKARSCRAPCSWKEKKMVNNIDGDMGQDHDEMTENYPAGRQ